MKRVQLAVELFQVLYGSEQKKPVLCTVAKVDTQWLAYVHFEDDQFPGRVMGDPQEFPDLAMNSLLLHLIHSTQGQADVLRARVRSVKNLTDQIHNLLFPTEGVEA